MGCDLSGIAEVNVQLLTECAAFQKATNLQHLQLPYLKQFYFNKKQENIENKLYIEKLRAEVKQLEGELQNETQECEMLQK